MNIANVKINGVEAVVGQLSPIPAGIVGATVSFQYDDNIWSGLRKTVVFRSVVIRDVIDAGAVVTIPPEVVAEGYTTLRVGVYGVDAQGTVVIPTLWAELGQVLPAADPSGDPSVTPELPVWAQIQAKIGDTDNLKTENRGSLVGAVNEVCGELTDKADRAELQEVNKTAKEAQAIAKGRATGHVFETEEDLDLWLAEDSHVAELVVGDNLYIRNLAVPDYWWDGAQKQPLETQKVDLSEYAKSKEVEDAVTEALQDAKESGYFSPIKYLYAPDSSDPIIFYGLADGLYVFEGYCKKRNGSNVAWYTPDRLWTVKKVSGAAHMTALTAASSLVHFEIWENTDGERWVDMYKIYDLYEKLTK